MRRRRRGGLVRTMGRTAVIAGTATAVSGAVAQKQHRKMAEQQQAAFEAQAAATLAAPEVPDSPSMDEKIEALQKLAALKDQGILTETEFEVQKAKILAS